VAEHEDDSDTIRRLMPQLLASARKKGVRAKDVEEVVQDAIVSGYKKERTKPRPSSEDTTVFTKWLFTLLLRHGDFTCASSCESSI
jgi:DNA-directed RNA polymerase specialized sigma24 family protein